MSHLLIESIYSYKKFVPVMAFAHLRYSKRTAFLHFAALLLCYESNATDKLSFFYLKSDVTLRVQD